MQCTIFRGSKWSPSNPAAADAGRPLAYVVSLTAAVSSQWGLRPLKLNIDLVTDPCSSCTNQLTGIHLSIAESSLSGHTSIYMVKHQISTRVEHTVVSHYIHSLCIPVCTSLTREVCVIQSVRDEGQYSQSGYAFRKTSFSLETFILTPNTGSCHLAVQNFMLA